jgi:hypothetical protein
MGTALQIATTLASLLTGALLASKRWRQYGYLLGFCSLPLWAAMEWYFSQWVFLALNPIYVVIWGVGLYRNWK